MKIIMFLWVFLFIKIYVEDDACKNEQNIKEKFRVVIYITINIQDLCGQCNIWHEYLYDGSTLRFLYRYLNIRT